MNTTDDVTRVAREVRELLGGENQAVFRVRPDDGKILLAINLPSVDPMRITQLKPGLEAKGFDVESTGRPDDYPEMNDEGELVGTTGDWRELTITE